MAKVKGKPRRLAPPYCRVCLGTKVTAERGNNTRTIHGVRHRVVNAVCQNKKCQHEWWTFHPDLLAQAGLKDFTAEELREKNYPKNEPAMAEG
jgi:hypothetical protein